MTTAIVGTTYQHALKLQKQLDLPDAKVISAYTRGAGRGYAIDHLYIEIGVPLHRYDEIKPCTYPTNGTIEWVTLK